MRRIAGFLVFTGCVAVAALSTLAHDPALSFVAARAASLPTVRASAEAVLRLHPDLVLAGNYGAQATVALLAEQGLPVVRVSMPEDFAGVLYSRIQLS